MRVILAPVGSHGDVLPLVAVGRELAGRGHAVTLATAEPFRGLAEAHGFAFAATGTQADYDRLTADPDLWHPTRSLKTLFGPPHFERVLREGYAAIAGAVEPGNTVVVAGSLSLAARVAHDALGVPLATAHLQPTAVPTPADPPQVGAARLPRWCPAWAWRLLYWGADRFLLDPLLAPPVNRLRADLGLPRVRRVFGPWRHSPQRLLAFFPRWFADAPDYPPQLRHVGFVRSDAAVKPTPPEVTAFLAAGPPPVAVSFGTAMRVGGPYFRAAAEALARLGLRGLILAKGGAQVPPGLPPTIRHADYAPFGEVLPRCAAVVHHGGIGTTAQALAAGVRQLVMPMAFDQPDNAARLGRLGVARTVWPKQFTPEAVAAALKLLLADDGAGRAAAALAARMAAEPDPLPLAADLVARLLPSPD